MPIYVNPIEPDEDDDAPTTIAEAILEAALNPKSVFVDGERVEARSIDELIKAEQHANAKEVAALGGWPLKRFKISPPSAV